VPVIKANGTPVDKRPFTEAAIMPAPIMPTARTGLTGPLKAGASTRISSAKAGPATPAIPAASHGRRGRNLSPTFDTVNMIGTLVQTACIVEPDTATAQKNNVASPTQSGSLVNRPKHPAYPKTHRLSSRSLWS